MSRSRIGLAIAAAVAVVVAGGIGLATVIGGAESDPLTTSSIAAESPAPSAPTPHQRHTDPLTGGRVSDHEVIAVKLENIAAARPQVGLSQADITFIQRSRAPDAAHRGLPLEVPQASGTDPQCPQHRRTAAAAVRQTRIRLFRRNSSVRRKINNASIVPILRTTRDSGGSRRTTSS